VQPLFLPVGSRAIFALHHAPAGPARGAVVYVPPFTEEMNKSRRMAALQSRALASLGWHVLQIDLHGTGDSEGDFSEATWTTWLEDVQAARSWLRLQCGHEPWLWGLRLGALLATAAAGQQACAGLLLWQPVVSGRQHLQQFLRLLAGADWLAGAAEARAQASPMADLQRGMAVEVAGYTLSPELALPMAEAHLALPEDGTPVHWLEVSPRAGASLSPVAQRLLAPRAGGAEGVVVTGPSFWQAQEIEHASELIDQSCRVMGA